MKTIKKQLCSILSASILCGMISVPALAEDGVTVRLNDQKIEFDVQPQIINERTMVPVRAIFEALGASVDWDGSTQTVTSKRGDTTVSLKINDATMYVNGSAVALDSPACIINVRTLVPVRAISEAFGATVDWDGSTQTVKISGDIVSAPVSYVDISSNVNEINNYINSGMYLEAMQACEAAKALMISNDDIALLDSLYNTAKSNYDAYIADQQANAASSYISVLLSKYKSAMKDPSSFVVYDIYAGYSKLYNYSDGPIDVFVAIVNAGGKNSFGAMVRDDTVLVYIPATSEIIIDLENLAENRKKHAIGQKYIKAIDLENEALTFEINKTNYTRYNPTQFGY